MTGATGFIGSHLTRRLLRAGLRVGILKRRGSDTWRLRDVLGRVQICEADVENGPRVRDVVGEFRPDVVFHLAAAYVVEHTPAELPRLFGTNVAGTVHLLEAARAAGVQLFVNSSSCFVYRPGRQKLSETSAIGPLNFYALTKVQAEDACGYYALRHGVPVVTLRLFPPYGPFDHARRLMPYVITSFLEGRRPRVTSGTQRWDLTYVEDIVDAYVRTLRLRRAAGRHEVFNIGTGVPIRLRDAVRGVRDAVRSSLEPEWGAVPHREHEAWYLSADTRKARRRLGWKPATSFFDGGLAATVEWFKSQGGSR